MKRTSNPSTFHLGLLLMALSSLVSCQGTSNKGFYKGGISTPMPLESKYKEMGPEHVTRTEFNSTDAATSKIIVVYPQSLGHTEQALPLVNMGNASNTTAYDMIEAMEHLASWGFVVIGNMDKQSGTGASISHTLDEFLALATQQDNPFYGKIDTHRIAIAGYSQGAFGAVMAATSYPNSHLYKAVYLCSCPQKQVGINFKWGESDFSRISAPLLMFAGTGNWDSNIISPEEAFLANFNEANDTIPVLASRHTSKDHEDMGAEGDPYMTAWFCHFLKSDDTAGKAFFGEEAEILRNTTRWKNVWRKGQ